MIFCANECVEESFLFRTAFYIEKTTYFCGGQLGDSYIEKSNRFKHRRDGA